MTLSSRPDPEWLPDVWAALAPAHRVPANFTTRQVTRAELHAGLVVLAHDWSSAHLVRTWRTNGDELVLTLSTNHQAIWTPALPALMAVDWQRLTSAQLRSLATISEQDGTPIRGSTKPDESGVAGVTRRVADVLTGRGLAFGATGHRLRLTAAGEATVLAHERTDD